MKTSESIKDYSKIKQLGTHVVLTEIKHFELAQVLDCGQAFRFAKNGENKFTGIAHGRRLDIEIAQGDLILHDMTLGEFDKVWRDYFDLGRGYAHMHQRLGKHKTMAAALAFSPGLRLMRQDSWEMLVSFILSQNSNIPRIKKMIETLCTCFGALLPCGGYAFPTPEALAGLTLEDMAVVRSGYRAGYILDAAKRVATGVLDLGYIATLPTAATREALLTIKGVGPKVADCVLLFGFGRLECFPLDVWMKRVMAELYPKGFPKALAGYAGIAQQFLFHYARVHGL